MGPEHGSRKKIADGKCFDFQSQKCKYKWIPKDQNLPMREFLERTKIVPKSAKKFLAIFGQKAD